MKIERIDRPSSNVFQPVAEWYGTAEKGDAIRISELPSEYTGASTERILKAVTDAIYANHLGRPSYHATISTDPAVVTVERADDSRTPYSWIVTKL